MCTWPASSQSTSSLHFSSPSGWQKGIRSWVRLAAMVPAMIAVWNTGPLAVVKFRSRSVAATSGGRITVEQAVALRRVTSLPLTSTMVGRPSLST